MREQIGFTLLELLVSIAIVGILTSIAIPQYSAYKKKAFDAAAISDLRSVALSEEAYFIDNDQYLPCKDDQCLALPGIVALSKGVIISVTTESESFIAQASHTKGTGKVYVWDSTGGGLNN